MENAKRWGISALSVGYKEFAELEEFMLNKQLGLTYVKTPDGNVISYNSLARFRNHVDLLDTRAQNLGIEGTLNSIELSGVTLPDVIPVDTNFLDSDLELLTTNPRQFILSVDMDCIEVSGLESVWASSQQSVTVEMVLKKDLNPDILFSVTKPISVLNNSVIDVQKLNEGVVDLNTYSLSIRSIKIVNHADNVTKTIRNIVSSVFVVI